VRRAGSHPTPDQQKDIVVRRSQLQEKVDSFQKQAAKLLNSISSDGDDFWDDAPTTEIYTGVEFDGIGEGEVEDEDSSSAGAADEHQDERRQLGNGFLESDSCVEVEHISVHLPSHLGLDWCNTNGAKNLAKAELYLREGQLNDSLHQIRIALGHKSYVFRNEVRPSRSQRLKTRAWKGVHAIEYTVQHHARVYARARQAIEQLGADKFLLDRYKVMTRQDLNIKTSVIAPHVRGQRNTSLPWFWTMDVQNDTNVGEWMEDCTCFSVHAC
jgi:hypothetical protein